MMNKLFHWLRARTERFTVHGAIESVDPNAQTITLRSGAETLEVLSVGDAKVMKAGQEMQLEDLYVGEKLSARAGLAKDGNPVAESVRIVEE